MGTSKSNSGPSKGSSLLPDWATDNSPQQEVNEEPRKTDDKEVGQQDANNENEKTEESKTSSTQWRSVRSAFTSYFKSSNDSRKLGRALNRYVKASGGAKKITKSAISGKSSGIKLEVFLNDVAQKGYVEALNQLGIKDLTGKSIESVFTQIAETLSPKGNEGDDPYARAAISEALSKIYEEFELADKDISELENIDQSKAFVFFELYVESYISERLIAEMGKNLENKEFSEKEVIDKEFEIKEYIKNAVKLEFKDVNLNDLNLSNPENSEKINDIFETAYQIMELL